MVNHTISFFDSDVIIERIGVQFRAISCGHSLRINCIEEEASRQRRLISSASFIFQPDESLIFDGV